MDHLISYDPDCSMITPLRFSCLARTDTDSNGYGLKDSDNSDDFLLLESDLLLLQEEVMSSSNSVSSNPSSSSSKTSTSSSVFKVTEDTKNDSESHNIMLKESVKLSSSVSLPEQAFLDNDNVNDNPPQISTNNNGESDSPSSLSLTLSSRSIVTENTASKTMERKRIYHCSNCDKSYFTRSHLNEHFKMKHFIHRPYSCCFCHKRFLMKKLLIDHLYTHGIYNKDRKRFVCTLCRKHFISNSSLKKHFQRHRNERAYPCQHCPLRFNVISDLKIHSDVHLEKMANINYDCHICGKTFMRKKDRDAHIKRGSHRSNPVINKSKKTSLETKNNTRKDPLPKHYY